MRPADGSAFRRGSPISIVARGPDARLELDGQELTSERPFPGVLHARTTPSAGPHELSLIWPAGRQQVRIFVGKGAPPEFSTFLEHPPLPVGCTQCHGLSRRGRFRFKGGCFDCHKEEAFASTHTHNSQVLEECGLCHNAHGSTVKAHLIVPREKACKQCHG